MEQKQTRDFLIRNMPAEVYNLLEKAAKEHHRSKTQEAIVALTKGLSLSGHQVKKPIPFRWRKIFLVSLSRKQLETDAQINASKILVINDGSH